MWGPDVLTAPAMSSRHTGPALGAATGINAEGGGEGVALQLGNACADQQKWGEVQRDEGVLCWGVWAAGAAERPRPRQCPPCPAPGPAASPPRSTIAGTVSGPRRAAVPGHDLGMWKPTCTAELGVCKGCAWQRAGLPCWLREGQVVGAPSQGTERLGGGACQGRDLEPGDQGVWTSFQELCGAEGGFGAG